MRTVKKRPESQGQPVKHSLEVLEKTAKYLWPELVSKYLSVPQAQKEVGKDVSREAHESIYVIFTSPVVDNQHS